MTRAVQGQGRWWLALRTLRWIIVTEQRAAEMALDAEWEVIEVVPASEVERLREAIEEHRKSFGEVPRGFDHAEDRELWGALDRRGGP